MPRYYCDYCDTYLTHDSPSVRKQHNAGYKHKANVRSYYQQFEEQQTQSLIDQRIKEHLGFQQQVGATFNQHLMSLPGAPQRPRLPVMPHMLPIGAAPQMPVPSALLPGVRPPLLPHPALTNPGYGAVHSGPNGAPTAMMPPPGSSGVQMSSLPRPPTLPPPNSGAMTMPTPNGVPSLNPVLYQANPTSAALSSFDPSSASSGSGNNN